MVDLELTVSGDDRIREDFLGNIPKSLRLHLITAISTSVIEIAQAARSLVHRKSGALAASMNGTVAVNPDKVVGRAIAGEKYAPWLEAGHLIYRGPMGRAVRLSRGMRRAAQRGAEVHGLDRVPAYPFMAPAFDSLRTSIEARIALAVEEGIK